MIKGHEKAHYFGYIDQLIHFKTPPRNIIHHISYQLKNSMDNLQESTSRTSIWTVIFKKETSKARKDWHTMCHLVHDFIEHRSYMLVERSPNKSNISESFGMHAIIQLHIRIKLQTQLFADLFKSRNYDVYEMLLVRTAWLTKAFYNMRTYSSHNVEKLQCI